MTRHHDSYNRTGVLRGSMASVFLAMVLDPAPQTIKSLEEMTGYTFKPLRQALDRLLDEGLVLHDEGRGYWLLAPGSPLLWRLQEAAPLAGEQYPAALLDLAGSGFAGMELSTEFSTGPEQTGECPVPEGDTPDDDRLNPPLVKKFLSPPSRESQTETGVYSTVDGYTPRPEIAAFAAGTGETPLAAGENPAAGEKGPAASGKRPASRAMHTTAANSFNPSSWEEEAVSKHSAHRNRASPELTPKQKLICAWLIQGGVGAHSPKMEELLRRNLDPRAVKAHVLERLACVQGLVQEKPDYAVGLLIRKLEDGDPAPQLRCEQCLELPNRNGLCRCDYADIIKR